MRMTDAAEAEFARRKVALHHKFLVVMQERRDVLAVASAGMRAGRDSVHVQDCRFAAHKTAGTAGAFGYEALGQTARTTCEALDAICDDASRAKALRLVEHFQAEIEHLLEGETARQET
jgi:HPt (histidine-containing phosphotransfer) domain-containing protein